VSIPDHLAVYPWYEPHQRWIRGDKGGVRANLRGANLTDANLRGANLTDANLTVAAGAIDAGTPNGWRVIGWLRGGWLSIRVGCHDIRLPEARAYWCESHPWWGNRQEIPPALDYVEAVARLRGWRMEEAS
jgi:hypothetical protein